MQNYIFQKFNMFCRGLAKNAILERPDSAKILPVIFENFHFSTPSDIFFQNHPKPIRKGPLTTPRHIPRHPKFDEKVTPKRPRGAGNRPRRGAGNRTGDLPTRLPKPLSEGQTTRLF